MCGAAHFAKPHGGERGVILRQLDPRLQLDLRQVTGARFFDARLEQSTADPLTLQCWPDREFPEIERVAFRFPKHTPEQRAIPPSAMKTAPSSVCATIASTVRRCAEDGGSIRPSI